MVDFNRLLKEKRAMTPVRRGAPPTATGINFIDDDNLYVGGGAIPEGDYALEFTVQMHSGFSKTRVGQARLGVMVNAYSLTEGDQTPKQFFLGFGKNVDKSFVPTADGKGIEPIPGGPSTTMNDQTNWNLFRQSMFDCGLPKGVASGSLTPLDGIWVHLTNVPEPESRKDMRKNTPKTGEVEEEEIKSSGTVPVVSEIKDDGKPWEGTGGFEFQAAPAPAPAARPAARPGVRPAAAPPARPAAVHPAGPRAVAPPAAVGGEEDVQTAAINAVSRILEKRPQGATKLLIRTETFKIVGETNGPEMAQTVLDSYFGDDATLNGLLGQLGFVIAGIQVKPQA